MPTPATLIVAALTLNLAIATTAPATSWRHLAVPQELVNAHSLFEGKLVKVEPGPVAKSLPPIYNYKLTFEVTKVYRGVLQVGDTVTLHHAARQHQPPKFENLKAYVLAASLLERKGVAPRLKIELIELADDKLLAQAAYAAHVPVGWTSNDKQFLSPWATLKDARWEPHSPLKPRPCHTTQRPAFLCGPDVQLTVEQVPPAVDIKWRNPDGDGEYKITMTNTSDRPITVPALLSDGERVRWDQSLVIVCQGKAYPLPGTKELAGGLQPTRLAPKQSVSTTVNALGLQGPDWPRGGYRIEFQFALGQLSSTQSFYYFFKHHDAIRAELAK